MTSWATFCRTREGPSSAATLGPARRRRRPPVWRRRPRGGDITSRARRLAKPRDDEPTRRTLGKSESTDGARRAAGPCAGTSAPVPRPRRSGRRLRRDPAPVLPGIEVLLADSVHLVRGPRGRAGHQPGRRRRGRRRATSTGCSAPASGWWRCSARSTASAAPPPRARPWPRRSTAPPAFQSTVSMAAPAPTDRCWPVSTSCWSTSPTSAPATTPTSRTTIEVMRAAERLGQPVVVLDRPNPIGGTVQGNMLEPRIAPSSGALAMPMRHGLTLGELARLANLDLAIGADLRGPGWPTGAGRSRSMVTGFPFLPPSPNLKDLESLFHYPGHLPVRGDRALGGAGDRFAVSPGRRALARYRTPCSRRCPAARLPGVQFLGVRFTPDQARRRQVRGDHRSRDPAGADRSGRRTIRRSRLPSCSPTIRRDPSRPDRFHVRRHFDRLAGGTSLREALLAGTRSPDRAGAGHRRYRARSPCCSGRAAAS